MKAKFLSIFIIGISISLQAQITQEVDFEVSTSLVKYLGTTPPLAKLRQSSNISPERSAKHKKHVKVPDNFPRRVNKSKAIYPELEHMGPDPIKQNPSALSRAPIELKVSRDGLSSAFGSPHDPSGATGRNHYMQAINATRIGIYNKQDGDLLDAFSADELWAPIGEMGVGDPILLYDQVDHRWIITEFANPANILIAVSLDDDPFGSYHIYEFSTPTFPDYPKYAIWGDKLVMTSNEGGPGVLHHYFLDKNKLFEGAEDATLQRVPISGSNGSQSGFLVATPVNWIGQTLPRNNNPVTLFLHDSSWGGVPADALKINSFNINFENPDSTRVTQLIIEPTAFDGFPCSAAGAGFACVPQLNGGGLDGIPEIVMNYPVYRNFGTHESIVLTFLTDVTDGENTAGVRWMELRRSILDGWSIYQEGTFTMDDGMDRFMSGISMDRDGNIALAYNITSEETQVGIRLTGRRAEDPLGTMSFEETIAREGAGTISSGGRFGDYPHMCIDPVNDRDFWFTTEYGALGNNSKTRIFSFSLERDSIDLGIISLNEPQTAPNLTNMEQVVFEYSNQGLEEINNYAIGFRLGGEVIEETFISDALPSLGSITHTFDTPIDMSDIGDYNIELFIEFEEDQNLINNTQSFIVTNLPNIDASISATALEQICGESADVEVELENFGGDVLTNVSFLISINGTQVNEIPWMGELENEDSETISFTIDGLEEGVNEVSIEASQPNNTDNDFNIDNNISLFNIERLPMEGEVQFVLLTDDYPDEITWEVTEVGSSDVLFSGGPYPGLLATSIVTDLCLEVDKCYILTLLDSYGDGICCNFGTGNYQVLDANGNELVASNGQFGSIQRNEFCVGEMICALELDVEVTNVSEDELGTILVSASNGVEPFTYSIDGVNFQDESLFTDLEDGEYEVIVVDAAGCSSSTVVLVDSTVSSSSVLNDKVEMNLMPNPGNGFYTLEVKGYDFSDFLNFEILNESGQFIKARKVLPYDGIHTTQISLLDYPDGIYYIRFMDKNISQLIKVIKVQ